MTYIELTAHVNENGELELPKVANLPLSEAEDETLWQKQFAESPEKLDFLINEGLEALRNGEAEDLDLDHGVDDL